MTEHSLIQIQEVVNLSVNHPELLLGFNIDTPDTSYKTNKYEVLFAGWILGKKAQVVSIEVISSGSVIHTIAVDNPRPDVAKTYAEESNAETCGFCAQVTVSEMPREVELHLQAVFSDRSRLLIGMVKFQKKLPFLQQIKADLEQSQTRLKQIKTKLNPSQLNDFKPQLSITDQKQNESILKYASHLSDKEWFEILVKSIQAPVIDGIQMPGFPADEIQNNFVGLSGEGALKEAFNFYSEVKSYATKLEISLTPESHILDFGCGWGRFIRFFLKDVVPENIYGIDFDPEMVDICRQTVLYGNYSTVKPQPPAGFPDKTFDVIYAYSVFSHLSEAVHIQWVEEFSKILRPGGILVATTRSRNFIEFCRLLRNQTDTFSHYQALVNLFTDTEAALADYDSGKFLYSPTGGGSVRDASCYGEAIISPGYVKREWSKYLTCHDFVDDPQRCNQAIIFMQKPA